MLQDTKNITEKPFNQSLNFTPLNLASGISNSARNPKLANSPSQSLNVFDAKAPIITDQGFAIGTQPSAYMPR